MKILFVIRSVNGYGAEMMLVWLANQMAERGCEVAIYTYAHEVCKVSLHPGITLVEPSSKAGKVPIFGIRKYIREWHPDCIVSFKLDANVFATVAAIGTHVPVVICDRIDPYIPGYWKLKLSKPIFNFSGAAVLQLDSVREYYKSVIHGPMTVIHNPVKPADAKVTLPFDQRANEIVCVGRLDLLNKRQDILIEAFRLAKPHLPPDTRIMFYGTGEDEAKVRAMCDKAGITDRCCFLGKVPEPYKKYCDSKLFVMTSDHEGIPNSLIEAMSIGMTCISTDTSPGGARLLIENKVNGILIPRDNPEALSKAIIECFEDTAMSDTLGRNARDITNRFQESDIADQWYAFLSQFSKT